jgi:peroxiredoxin
MKRRDFLTSSIAGGISLAIPFSTNAAVSSYMLEGTDVYGKKLSLEDYAGRTLLVSFFTVDCDVCSHDLKLMREFYVGNANKKFTLIGVNLDQNKKELDEYNEITTQAYPKNQRFPTVWRNAAGHQDNFGKISTTPTHFVLDAKRHLVFKREGAFKPDDWDNLWAALG